MPGDFFGLAFLGLFLAGDFFGLFLGEVVGGLGGSRASTFSASAMVCSCVLARLSGEPSSSAAAFFFLPPAGDLLAPRFFGEAFGEADFLGDADGLDLGDGDSFLGDAAGDALLPAFFAVFFAGDLLAPFLAADLPFLAGLFFGEALGLALRAVLERPRPAEHASNEECSREPAADAAREQESRQVSRVPHLRSE